MTYPIPEHKTWQTLDSSKLREFTECPRKFFYSYMLGWRPDRPNNHLVFGDAWHGAMEHLLLNGYGDEQVVDAEDIFYSIYRKEFPEETDELFTPKTPFRAVKALAEYAQKYEDDLSHFDVDYTEIAGSVSVADGMAVTFRMDSICHDENGYFSLEHKTSQGPFGNRWAMQWPLDIATGTYTHALKCIYPPNEVRGVIFNGSFFRKTKVPAFDFHRLPAYKDREQMQVWLYETSLLIKDVKQNMKELEHCSDSDNVLYAFPMRTTSCTNYFGCRFHDYCQAWANPLQHCAKPPLGFKVSFWDPFEKPYKEKMEL